MDKREVIKMVLDGKVPPYVPWEVSFTYEPGEMLKKHFSCKDLHQFLDNHMAVFGSSEGFFTDIGGGRVKDVFGVIWDRSVEKSIGNVEGVVLKEPTLKNFIFPSPDDPVFYRSMHEKINNYSRHFKVYAIGFSLFERAWTLRGMENLMMDMIERPEFVHELLTKIADFNIKVLKKALAYDIDGIHFGDDWGQQHGLIMGPKLWYEFIYPQVKLMYKVGKDAGKYVSIHSCGDVDELFSDLNAAGLNCFNPFQPEVMDTEALLNTYRGKLSFWGGLSTQKILPYGSADEVRAECRRLFKIGIKGGYIFSPAHAVPSDVPLENIQAFIEEMQSQPEYKKLKTS